METIPLVEMRNIEKYYGHIHALKGIDFTVNEREVVGLVDSMDIKRNVYLGREPTLKLGPVRWLNLKKMAVDSLSALKRLGLEIDSPSVRVDELSGGQRQGVAIARAIYFRTNLLLLHNLYHVYPIADRIVILKLGEKIGEFKKGETTIDELINLVKT